MMKKYLTIFQICGRGSFGWF